MSIKKHAFQMVNIFRKPSVVEDLPKDVEITIDATMQNPPKLISFKGIEVAVITTTVSITIEDVIEAVMRGETIYEFKDASEKARCEKSLKEENKLPSEIEEYLMNAVGGRALLLLVKSHVEIGIPPPISLPRFDRERRH